MIAPRTISFYCSPNPDSGTCATSPKLQFTFPSTFYSSSQGHQTAFLISFRSPSVFLQFLLSAWIYFGSLGIFHLIIIPPILLWLPVVPLQPKHFDFMPHVKFLLFEILDQLLQIKDPCHQAVVVVGFDHSYYFCQLNLSSRQQGFILSLNIRTSQIENQFSRQIHHLLFEMAMVLRSQKVLDLIDHILILQFRFFWM